MVVNWMLLTYLITINSSYPIRWLRRKDSSFKLMEAEVMMAAYHTVRADFHTAAACISFDCIFMYSSICSAA